MLAAINVGEMSGHQIGESLDHAEADDERENARSSGDFKFLSSNERHHRTLQSHHAADKGVDQNKQGELLPVGAQAKSNAWNAFNGGHCPVTRPEFSARTWAACGGAGGMSASIVRRNVGSSSIRNALLKRFSKPIVDVGLPLRLRPHTEPE